LLGGELTVKSVYGEGSTFSLVLRQARIGPGTGEHPELAVTIERGGSDAT